MTREEWHQFRKEGIAANGFKDLNGRVFSRLTVLERWGKIRKEASWLCVCACGNFTIASGYSLRSRGTRSCGCLSRELSSKRFKTINLTHGMEGTPIYKRWSGMISRCRGSHKNYGGRGIAVCKRWLKFENFYKDMGDSPSKIHSIDRIDNNKGYSRGNCRWATPKEQANNKRTNTYRAIGGKRLTLKQIATMYKISYAALVIRVSKNKDTPIKELVQRAKKRLA